jgi:hypothetical protein
MESKFPLHEHTPSIYADRPRYTSLIRWPNLTADENPLRQLKYTHEMMQSFRMLKAYLRNKFALLNTGFPAGKFNTCMNCWVGQMYRYSEQMKEDTQEFLMFLNAHDLMYSIEVYGKFCVTCQGPMPLGKNRDTDTANGAL